MIINSINKVDINIKNKLYEKIILSGGNTKFKRIEEKMKINLMNLVPRGIEINKNSGRARINLLERRKYCSFFKFF